MKLAEDILNEIIPDASDNFDANYKSDVIEAMHLFSNQFKSWIPVTEKLPEEEQEVIAYDKDTNQQWTASYIMEYGEKIWRVEEREEYIQLENVTHFHYLLPNPQQPTK